MVKIIQDQGPRVSLGYGIDSRQLPGVKAEDGGNPQGGILSKALHDHPVMRFFAASAATMIAMHVAGKVAQEGGIHLISKLAEDPGPWLTQRIQDFRKVQSTLDEWQGLTRYFADPADETKLFVKNADGKLVGDEVHDLTGFVFSQREQEQMAAEGLDSTAAGWTWKNEVQKRMVSQARKLPYELPAAWAAQRAVVDPLFGTNPQDHPLNWWNPVDVISDFATQSVKNMAFMIAPFDVAGGAANNAVQKFLTYGDNMVSMSPGQQNIQTASLTLKAILAKVGADSSDILSKGMKLSSQSAGSFATFIQEGQANKVGLPQYLRQAKIGLADLRSDPDYQKLTFAGRTQQIASNLLATPGHGAPLSIWDTLPGPFQGMGSGLKAARNEWRIQGQAQDAYSQLLKLGPTRFAQAATEPGNAYFNTVGLAYGRGTSPIEELAQRMNVLGKGGSGSKSFEQGQFYKDMLNNEYAKTLKRNLLKKGVAEQAADRFVRLSQISPLRGNLEGDLSSRVAFGKGQILSANDDDFFDQLHERLGKFKNPTHFDQLKANLKDSISDTDKIFGTNQFRMQLDSRIKSQWNYVERNVIPQYGANIVGKAKLPYEDFSPEGLTAAKREFLLRRTASQAGMDVGRETTDQQASSFLLSRGFGKNNAIDYGQLSAYLTNQNVIAQPWTRQGRNLFGFKSLSVSEAMSKGMFSHNKNIERDVQGITSSMAFNDPVSRLVGSQYQMKGVYQTASGDILDTSILRRRGRKFVDKLASSFEIPFIHLKPLQTAGIGLHQDAMDHAIMQFIPSMSRQPMLGAQGNEDFYMWMRSGVKGTKGRVLSFGTNEEGQFAARKIAGEFVPLGTDPYKLTSRSARLAIRENGLAPFASASPMSKFQDMFKISSSQPESVAGYINRFRNRRLDTANPIVMAKFMAGEDVVANGDTYRMVGGQIVNVTRGAVHKTAPEVARDFLNLGSALRTSNFSPKVLTQLEKLGTNKDLLGFDFGSRVMTTLGDVGKSAGFVPITDIQTSAQAMEFAQGMMEFDKNHIMGTLSSEQQSALRRAQSATVWRHLDRINSPQYLDRAASQSVQSSTVSTRLDELKMDMYRYLSARTAIVGDESFSQMSVGVMEDLAKLRSRGLISQADMVESQAALLSLQIHGENFRAFSRVKPSLTNVQNTMAAMDTPTAKALFSHYASGLVGTEGGLKGNAIAALKRNLSISKARYNGVEYNPFGNTNTVLVPTFRTALSRSPVRALRSLIGSGSWDSPETFSRAAIPMSHMMTRLNKYLGPAGLALDENAFKSPLDFYTRGIVGRRVLPIVAGTTAFLTADRTLGGFLNKKDQYGDRVYRPYFTGLAASAIAQGQMALAGIIPGGQTYQEKKEELLHGNIPVRSGRWWPLGSTPWKGGRIQYFRPSWYQRFNSAYQFTGQNYGSPLEKLMFDDDFSPLRPLAPYHWENKHINDRPYPETGDYFTGPWGPLTGALNLTVGRLLKPHKTMHAGEAAAVLGSYAPVGQYGAYLPSDYGSLASGQNIEASSNAPFSRNTASVGVSGSIASSNASSGSLAVLPRNTASTITSSAISSLNAGYSRGSSGVQRSIGRSSGAYGIAKVTDAMPPEVVAAMPPMSADSTSYQVRKLGYQSQEMFGVYGFATSALRQRLGFGRNDLTTYRPVLDSASRAYGSTRAFWDLNLGGAGDAPLPIEGNMANIEFSEIARRFIPSERSQTQFINPIPNDLGKMYPWLPGADYFTNFRLGDPYTSVAEGEIRLPGAGYDRLHKLHSDMYGKYGLVDQHAILGDVAPWSTEFKAVDQAVTHANLSPQEEAQVEQTRQQVQAMSQQVEFSPYKYKYSSAHDLGISEFQYFIRSKLEGFAHNDSFFNSKFLPKRTAIEDWDRENVYGTNFQQWSHPINDFLKPTIYKATQRNPFASAGALAAVGTFFGANPEAKAIGGIIGGSIGFTAGLVGSLTKDITGSDFVPASRRKQVSLDEYSDILQYVKAVSGMQQAKAEGDQQSANTFLRMAQSTMYGADVYGSNDVQELQNSLPKRKRPYFQSMITAPVQERQAILATAGRLERRIYEGAWGMPVEQRPDLGNYFSEHELPSPDWEGWHPNTNMDLVKIKMGENLGIDMAQMGYYPQQVRDANLINPSYPNFGQQSDPRDVQARLRELMISSGVSGNVTAIRTPFPGTKLHLNIGG